MRENRLLTSRLIRTKSDSCVRNIVFNTLQTFDGNTVKYNTATVDLNNVGNTVLASPNPATPTVTPTTYSLVLTAEDGTTTKTYTFKIEIVCANPTLEDLSVKEQNKGRGNNV